MTSMLIIGCRKCASTHQRMKDANLVKDYIFPFSTAYTERDIGQLLQFYLCPYCESALYLSPVTLGLLNKFLQRPYHISIEGNILEFASETISLSIPVKQSQEKTKEIIEKLGLLRLSDEQDFLPSIKEIQWIQLIAQQMDRKQWFIQIHSSHITTNENERK